MKIIGQNGSSVIVELEEDDLCNYIVSFDYWKKAISIELKAGILQQARKELSEAKGELEKFVRYNCNAFEKIVKAGTLVGILFEDKTNKIIKQ